MGIATLRGLTSQFLTTRIVTLWYFWRPINPYAIDFIDIIFLQHGEYKHKKVIQKRPKSTMSLYS